MMIMMIFNVHGDEDDNNINDDDDSRLSYIPKIRNKNVPLRNTAMALRAIITTDPDATITAATATTKYQQKYCYYSSFYCYFYYFTAITTVATSNTANIPPYTTSSSSTTYGALNVAACTLSGNKQ